MKKLPTPPPPRYIDDRPISKGVFIVFGITILFFPLIIMLLKIKVG